MTSASAVELASLLHVLRADGGGRVRGGGERGAAVAPLSARGVGMQGWAAEGHVKLGLLLTAVNGQVLLPCDFRRGYGVANVWSEVGSVLPRCCQSKKKRTTNEPC